MGNDSYIFNKNISTKVSVSVVVPCYRCADTIERAIQSVYHQTMKPYEVILIDDFSEDKTLDRLYDIQNKYNDLLIKVIPLPKNVGPGAARNIGWNLSKQKYIAFLDSDDSWHPNKIKFQYTWMKSNPQISLSGHACRIVNTTYEYKKVENVTFNELSKNKLLFSNKFLTPSVMLKTSLTERFPENQKYSEDYNLWLNILFSGKASAYSDSELGFLYKASYGESGLSSQLYKMQVGELSNYKYLYSKGYINAFQYIFFTFFSLIKYLKRVII